MEFAGRKVWIKRAVPGKAHWGHRVQRVLARLIPMRLLRFTADTAGQPALDREAAIIERLRRRGAHVPEVLARGPGWIALSDLGPSLQKSINEARNRADATQLAKAGAWALLRLHRADGWHGNPQARNLTGRPEHIGFIDFEEDVGAHLGTSSAQVRDWILYLTSLHKTEQRFPGLLANLVADVQPDLPIHVRKILLRIHLLAAPFAPLLRPLARWLGRDVRQAITLWEALAEIDPPLRRRLRLVVRLSIVFCTLAWLWSETLD